MRKEFNIQSSLFQGKRSEGLPLFFLIAKSLTRMASEHIQSMTRPSISGTAFTTWVKSKIPSAQRQFNGRTLHALARCMDVNDLPAKGVCLCTHMHPSDTDIGPILTQKARSDIGDKAADLFDWTCFLSLWTQKQNTAVATEYNSHLYG